MILYICLGLAGLTVPLSLVYAYLRGKLGKKAIWFKMLVSALALAIAVLTVLDPYSRSTIQIIMAAAIGLCFLGDLAIGVKDQRMILGIGVFGLAHIALSAAFAMMLDSQGNSALAIFLPVFFGLIAVTTLFIFVLKLNMSGKTYAVIIYLLFISASVGLAYATLTLNLPYGFLIPLGASLFFVSDLLLGYSALKKDNKVMGYISMLAYFSAIACLALSIGLCL